MFTVYIYIYHLQLRQLILSPLSKDDRVGINTLVYFWFTFTVLKLLYRSVCIFDTRKLNIYLKFL